MCYVLFLLFLRQGKTSSDKTMRQRYSVDYSIRLQLLPELSKGMIKLVDWLRKQHKHHQHVVFKLPNHCGYTPVAVESVTAND